MPHNAQNIVEAKSPFTKLSQLIGLAAAKMKVKEISDFAKVQKARKARVFPLSEVSYHLMFTVNPETKKTVGRLVAQIYKELDMLSKRHLIEATAKDLVTGYIGAL